MAHAVPALGRLLGDHVARLARGMATALEQDTEFCTDTNMWTMVLWSVLVARASIAGQSLAAARGSSQGLVGSCSGGDTRRTGIPFCRKTLPT